MLSADELNTLVVEARVDREAMDRLLALYRPVLRLLAEQLLAPEVTRREDASDIVQRTVLEAFQAIEQFHGGTEAEFSAWIKQILRRNVVNAERDHQAAKRDIRREERINQGGDSVSVTWWQLQGSVAPPSQVLIKAEAAIELALALEQLPEAQRDAVSLRHLEGRTLDEIAATMERTPSAVAGLLRRGLQTLRDRLGPETPNL